MRAAVWKHREVYYDEHSERWTTTKDDAANSEQEEKRRIYDPEFHQELNLSDSSGDKDLETAVLSNPGM